VGTGGGELKHDLTGQAAYMAYQQDTDFGVLDIHFSDNKLVGKFINNDGAIMDQFSIDKAAKKKVIESISGDTFGDTNAMTVSDKDTANKTPLVGQVALDGKPSITFKLDEDAKDASNKANPLAGQDGKPSITFKLDEGAETSTNAKVNPMELQQAKPSITFKLEDATADNGNTNPVAGQEVQEVKPAVSAKLDVSTPAKKNPMLLSEEQVEQEQTKPAMTTKLDDSDNPPTDDKDKSVSFASNDNTGKSNIEGLLETTGGDNDMSDEDSDSTTKAINTNVPDPFASLN
jgi:hypothetical protein